MSAEALLVGMSLTGSVLQSEGERQSGRAEQRAYNARAFNQILTAGDLEVSALLQGQQTSFEGMKLRDKINVTRSSQMASVAASGIEYSGSARQFIEADAERQEYDALMLQFNGYTKQLGLEKNASYERMNADILRDEGKLAYKAGRAKAATTLLTGAGKAATSGLALYNIRGGDNASNT